jgi:hypothetical protein
MIKEALAYLETLTINKKIVWFGIPGISAGTGIMRTQYNNIGIAFYIFYRTGEYALSISNHRIDIPDSCHLEAGSLLDCITFKPFVSDEHAISTLLEEL